jgi:hypothetical protein
VQHFTWRRFLALLIGGLVLFVTSTWAPFRRLLRAVPALPPHGAGAGPGGAAEGGEGDGQGANARPARRCGFCA